MNQHKLIVAEDFHGQRLDVYLTNVLPDVPSRTFVQKLIDGGYVLINGARPKAKHKMAEGEKVNVEFPDELLAPQKIVAEKISLDIFYEDEHLLVVNKPVGMLVHPTTKIASGTLVNALLHHCRKLSDINTETRPGIVHRLDQNTSGLLVVAKDNRTHARLARQFVQHKIHKKYLALVEGRVEFDEGIIDVPLGKHSFHHEQRHVDFSEAGKDSVTVYKALKRTSDVTYIALFPKTGRTHQLRVHMAHIGHPILGDDKYGRKDTFFRLALHAQSLGFIHPQTKQFMEFSSLPPKEFLEKVKDGK